MPTYTKTTWVDEVPYVTPNHYVITGANSDCTIALKNAPTVTGTPINATNLNKVENQLDILSKPSAVLIQKIVGTGAADEFNFASIPTGYDGLKLFGRVKQTFTGGSYPATNCNVRFNNDSGSNYKHVHELDESPFGHWESPATQLQTFPIVGSWTADANYINTFDLEVHFYDSAFYKMGVLRGTSFNASSNPTVELAWRQCLWMSTTAINRIQLFGTFTSSSWVSLYGVTNWV